MSGFGPGSVPPWAWVCVGCLCALFLLLGLWFGFRGLERAYDDGYDDGQADAKEAAELAARERGVAMVRAAGRRAWELARPAELESLPLADNAVKPFQAIVPPVSSAGYLRGLQRVLGETATVNLARNPDDLYDPDDDPSFTVREEWAVPLEYPPAEPAYAWEPWSLSADTTLEEEVAAMIANADASPSVRWLAELEDGQ
jgi:hypothetical protein